jgi:hypothetical protein
MGGLDGDVQFSSNKNELESSISGVILSIELDKLGNTQSGQIHTQDELDKLS